MADADYTLGDVIECARRAVDECSSGDQTYQPNDEALRGLAANYIIFASMECFRPLSELSELSREEKSDLGHTVVKLRVGPLYKPWIASGQIHSGESSGESSGYRHPENVAPRLHTRIHQGVDATFSSCIVASHELLCPCRNGANTSRSLLQRQNRG